MVELPVTSILPARLSMPYLLRTGLPAGLSAHLTPAPHVQRWGQCCGLVTSRAQNSSMSPVCHLQLCVHVEPSFLASESASSLWSLITIPFKGVCEGPGPVLSIGEALDR